jgi:AraC-like DNA-binding protein
MSSRGSGGGYDRVLERRRAVALARHFRETEGLSIAEIAERLGRSSATVKAYFYDPTGEKARAVKARYAGVCRGCGAYTRPECARSVPTNPGIKSQPAQPSTGLVFNRRRHPGGGTLFNRRGWGTFRPALTNVALIVLDLGRRDRVRAQARAARRAACSGGRSGVRLRVAVAGAVNAASERLARVEQIKRFEVLAESGYPAGTS